MEWRSREWLEWDKLGHGGFRVRVGWGKVSSVEGLEWEKLGQGGFRIGQGGEK